MKKTVANTRPDKIAGSMKAPSLPYFAPRRLTIAGVVFALAVGVTLLTWHVTSLSIRSSSARTFEEHVARTEQIIQERMRSYEQVLRGGGGLFAASAKVSRDDWRRFVDTLNIHDSYPGVRGVHYAPRVTLQELTAHIAAVQAEGFPLYTVRPDGARAEYFPDLWPEPGDERGRRVMGFDGYADPVRRAAMDRARDTGRPMVSGKVKLAGEVKDDVPGFVYYYPVYAREMPVSTVEERRRALTGFIFCPIRMPDLMEGLGAQARDTIDIEIYNGPVPNEAGLMYDDDGVRRALSGGDPPAFGLARRVEFGGNVWTVYFEASPKFIAGIDASTPTLILAAGMVLSVIVTVLIWSLLTSEALALTASMHDGLTGLFNRRYLEASLKREEGRARRTKSAIAIVQFDLDFFKKLNDTYGHAAGDEVLRRVGEVLRAATRGEDIACRYGGEEFTLIMPGATVANAEARAIALGKQIAELKIGVSGEWLPRITISGGVAGYPQDGSTLAEVLRRADHALLRAKREGRARVLVAGPDDPVTVTKPLA
jgi:diguanylate cyclase (GGDEF)-like protein